MDITYHYPPELFQLLVETIPKLCRSKKDLILFFRGSGIERTYLYDLEEKLRTDRDSINKYDITRKILQRLNEKGEATLRERREVLRRVVEFEDFSTCWSKDALIAKGLVAEIRRVVSVKDSFTRMRQERDFERKKSIEKARADQERKIQKKKALIKIKKDLYSLFSRDNPQSRGTSLEPVLNSLFKESGLLIRESFQRLGEYGEGVVEQIDGVIELDGEIYLVEIKWLKKKVGKGDVSEHLVRVFSRHASRGIFISFTEFTPAAIKICEEALTKTTVFLCIIEEIVRLLECEGDLRSFLKEKLKSAVVEKKPFVKIVSFNST